MTRAAERAHLLECQQLEQRLSVLDVLRPTLFLEYERPTARPVGCGHGCSEHARRPGWCGLDQIGDLRRPVRFAAGCYWLDSPWQSFLWVRQMSFRSCAAGRLGR
jgi:hypothetical protein